MLQNISNQSSYLFNGQVFETIFMVNTIQKVIFYFAFASNFQINKMGLYSIIALYLICSESEGQMVIGCEPEPPSKQCLMDEELGKPYPSLKKKISSCSVVTTYGFLNFSKVLNSLPMSFATCLWSQISSS